MSVKIFCNVCKQEIETIIVDQYTTHGFLDDFRNPDRHLCNACWIKEQKKKYNLSKQGTRKALLPWMN